MDEEKSTRIIEGKENQDDTVLDVSLRPKELADFIGQNTVKENLRIFMEAAKKRGEALEHVLLYGPPGLGKTTLAHIISREMKVNIRITSGPALERSGDMAAILTSLSDNDILFVDEIHRLPKIIEEVLYPAMEDRAIDLIIGKGPGARTLRLELPKFTLIGATTKISSISSPLRDRFGNIFHLSFYDTGEIEKIIARSAKILGVSIDDPSVTFIAQRARKTPRVANRLLKRVRDFVEVRANGIIHENSSKKAFEMLGVDDFGLDEIDRKILNIIIEKFNGGPVGLNTIAAATGEEMSTIEDVYEPFLIQCGFLHRTPQGRVATDFALKHLGLKRKALL